MVNIQEFHLINTFGYHKKHKDHHRMSLLEFINYSNIIDSTFINFVSFE